jgi:hypothetical protein
VVSDAHSAGLLSRWPRSGFYATHGVNPTHRDLLTACVKAVQIKLLVYWRPRRDLNPCYRRERASHILAQFLIRKPREDHLPNSLISLCRNCRFCAFQNHLILEGGGVLSVIGMLHQLIF